MKDQERPAPAESEGLTINGVNVRLMNEVELEGAIQAALGESAQHDLTWQRAQQAFIQFRSVIAILMFERNRRRKAIAIVSLLPNGGHR